MNDLDAFRAALHAEPPDLSPGGPDLAHIMRTGTRIRRRRRALTGAGAALAVAAVLAGGMQLNQPAASSPAGPGPAAPSVSTTIGSGGWTFEVRPVEAPAIEFGVLALGPGGQDVMANEVEGSATDPGFHAVTGTMRIGEKNTPTPLFGYYAGPADRVTATANGRVYAARIATPAARPDIRIFWFDPAEVGPDFKGRDLTAYDVAGNRLPEGNRRQGVG